MTKFMHMAMLAALLTPPAGTSAAPACTVSAVPRVSLSPLRYLRVRTVVEPNQLAARVDLALIGPAGLVTSSLLWERGETEQPPRTTQTEWRHINEDDGSYEIVLEVRHTDGSMCRAVERIRVGGSEPDQ